MLPSASTWTAAVRPLRTRSLKSGPILTATSTFRRSRRSSSSRGSSARCVTRKTGLPSKAWLTSRLSAVRDWSSSPTLMSRTSVETT